MQKVRGCKTNKESLIFERTFAEPFAFNCLKVYSWTTRLFFAFLLPRSVAEFFSLGEKIKKKIMSMSKLDGEFEAAKLEFFYANPNERYNLSLKSKKAVIRRTGYMRRTGFTQARVYTLDSRRHAVKGRVFPWCIFFFKNGDGYARFFSVAKCYWRESQK